jgi:hypothetical protein
MNVFLVENESYPESFEVLGNGLALVGDFPTDVHAGYGEKLQLLLGKTVYFSEKGGDPQEPEESTLTLPGKPAMKVLGGWFVAENFSGKQAGSTGDMALSGRITIRVQTDAGEKTIDETFAAHCVSWG